MTHLGIHALVGSLIISFSVALPAQKDAQERAASLRAQLVEVQARQVELQARLEQLEEDLKPENIERSLAGVGSTHPEDLRAARRRQLEIEKKGVQSQLDVLDANRSRLEAAIARADAESYQQSAGVGSNPGPEGNTAATTSHNPRRFKKHRHKKAKKHQAAS